MTTRGKRTPSQETFWDQRSGRYDDTIRKHDALYERTIASTRALLGKAEVVLDFACASGEFGFDLAPHVREVVGIDSSAKMIELAQRKARCRGAGNIAFRQADAFDRHLEPQSFSAIVAFNILHLLDDAPGVLNRLYDLLTPGGLLISQTPCLGDRGWLFTSLIRLAQRFGLAPAIRSFTTAELESLVSGSAFEILDSRVWDEKHAIQWIVARKP